MEDFAFGELQLLPDVFFDLTPAHYFRMVSGYYRRLEHERWEPIRWLATIQVNTQRGKDDPVYQPQDLLTLRKDPPPPPPPPPPTAEELAAQLAALDELDKDLVHG